MDEKPILTGLVRDNAKTPEGKYLVKRRDGTVVEWRSFVLGARDEDAADTLRFYADRKEKRGKAHPGWIAAMRRWADEMDAERAATGAGDPELGIHRQDDPATIAEMRQGMSA